MALLSMVARLAESHMPPAAFAEFLAQCDVVTRRVFGVSFAQLAREGAARDTEWTPDDDRAALEDWRQRRAAYAAVLHVAYLAVRDGMTAALVALGCASAVVADYQQVLLYLRWLAAREAVTVPEYPPLSGEALRASMIDAGWQFCEASAGDPVYDASGQRIGVLSEAEAVEIRQQVRVAPDGTSVR